MTFVAPTSEKIYDAAVRLFGHQTYSATSMRDISDAVGILPGSLYTHISSKEQLLLAIVESGIDKYLEAIGPAASSAAPADERMRAAIKAHLDVLAANREQTLIAFHQWKNLGEANRRRVIKKRNTYEALFSKIVQDGLAAGVFEDLEDPRLAVLAIIGMLNGAPEWFSPSGRRSAEEVGDILADLVISGLTGRPSKRTARRRPGRAAAS
jgi:AcrR family transcriptional regulator